MHVFTKSSNDFDEPEFFVLFVSHITRHILYVNKFKLYRIYSHTTGVCEFCELCETPAEKLSSKDLTVLLGIKNQIDRETARRIKKYIKLGLKIKFFMCLTWFSRLMIN